MQLQGKWERVENAPDKFHVTWECVQEAVEVVNRTASLGMGDFGIIAIAGGGLIPASMLARECPFPDMQVVIAKHYNTNDVRQAFVLVTYNTTPLLTPGNKYLIVDDIYDSGKTILEVQETLRRTYPDSKMFALGHVLSACLFWRKQTREESPTFYGCEVPDDRWLVFPWEPGWMQYGKVEDATLNPRTPLTPLTPLPDTTGDVTFEEYFTPKGDVVRRNLTLHDWGDIRNYVQTQINKARFNITPAPRS